MNNLIGLIGPKDSVKKMLEIGEEFSNFSFLPLSYKDANETADLILKQPEIKYWMFSGPSPYYYALKKGVIKEENSLFVPLVGASLTKALFEAVYHDGYKLDRMSFDTYYEKEINEVFMELGIEPKTIKVFTYGNYEDSKEIAAFHRETYLRGEVDYAITCLVSVYRILIKEKIPAVRIAPTRMVIRQTMELLQQKIEKASYMQSSIAIISIKLFFQQQEQDEEYSYKYKQEQLLCEKLILSYSKKVNGSMIRIGDALYFIFSTRGELKQISAISLLSDLMDDISRITRFNPCAGIGFGENVFNAEKNSRLALQYASQYKYKSLFLISEEGKVEGPIKGSLSEEKINFLTRNIDSLDKLPNLQLSPMQWSRVKAYLGYYNKEEITANELATWLHMTDRNARRILSELEKNGLIQRVGLEQPGPRGRPRKVFRITQAEDTL